MPNIGLFVCFLRLPDANVAAATNKCRNPNMASGGPWCYTTDNTTRTEYCDVPLCGQCTHLNYTSYRVSLVSQGLKDSVVRPHILIIPHIGSHCSYRV